MLQTAPLGCTDCPARHGVRCGLGEAMVGGDQFKVAQVFLRCSLEKYCGDALTLTSLEKLLSAHGWSYSKLVHMSQTYPRAESTGLASQPINFAAIAV